MPLKKLVFKPGVDRETTRYTSEGGWYECDKVRFRSGSPEKIGGWQRISTETSAPYVYLGVCRSLWPWATLGGVPYVGVGTNVKYYVMSGGAYNDITPVRVTTVAGDISLALTYGSNVMTVTNTAHGCVTGDYVTFSGATGFPGNVTAAVIDQEYEVTVLDVNTYTVTLPVVANAANFLFLDLNFGANLYSEWTTTETVVGAYQVGIGNAYEIPLHGWGAGAWGAGPWGTGGSSGAAIRIWNHQNFGEDLVYGPKGGGIYYWDASLGLTNNRGVAASTLPGASSVPLYQNVLVVSDASRFVFAMGTNDFGSTDLDPMLIRWSDQESVSNWTPSAVNQAGSIRLSHGSKILGYSQVRQEILVWTDTSLYSLQYLGPPVVWSTQLLADNITLVSDRAMVTGAGVTYWMGDEKFYAYDGRVQTLPCGLRQYVFGDFNKTQSEQVFASTIEQFNEIWWFYCSQSGTGGSPTTPLPDRYVVYNYVEKIWYYGTMSDRTAWIDASVYGENPISAYHNRLLYQEVGLDDAATGTIEPIDAYITSAEFDIDDGHNLGFVWRILPDITFRGSTAVTPKATMTLLPLQNSGSGYNYPLSEGGSASGQIVKIRPQQRVSEITVEQFTGQVNIRVRGRQMAMKIESSELGVAWQLGAPRIDIRPDGRKS